MLVLCINGNCIVIQTERMRVSCLYPLSRCLGWNRQKPHLSSRTPHVAATFCTARSNTIT